VDPYALLELEVGASTEDIKKAWKRLARRHHPDLNPDDPTAADRFKAITNAYERLMAGEGEHAHTTAMSAMDPDWVDSVRWMVEVRRRAVMNELMPRFISTYGARSALAWALRDARDLRHAATTLKDTSGLNTLWSRFVVRRLPLDVVVDDTPGVMRMASIEQQRNGRVALVLFANALWRQRPEQEEQLRELVFTAVDYGLAAAVPAALHRRRVPPTLDAAQQLDRWEIAQEWFWRMVWSGIAGLALTMFWIMVTNA